MQEYPNPCFRQIEQDVARTFPDDEFFAFPQTQTKIKNILQAYVKRNPTVGYCQGMNFLAARLLKILHEEVC